jgi:SCF-associated factor 1
MLYLIAEIGNQCYRFTWGGYSNCALGLGHSIGASVRKPTEVLFDQNEAAPLNAKIKRRRAEKKNGKSKETFCYLAAAAGRHTGALVIDIEVCALLTLCCIIIVTVY